MTANTLWGRGLARLFVGGCAVLGAAVPSWAASPSVEKMLEYKPRQEAVITVPSATEAARCTVELDKGKDGGSGWVLKDGAGKTLRRFYSSTPRGAVDLYSYYKDGAEVYREVVSGGARQPNQFRWINAGGSKWGVDVDGDGKIDRWQSISVEEVSQELMRAIGTKDQRRLEALLVTDADLAELGIAGDLADGIKARRKEIAKKFEATCAKLTKLDAEANWLHIETAAPERLLAEQIGAKADLIRHARGTVLFEKKGASDWFQTGPLVKVGDAWKIIDAPVPGATVPDDGKAEDKGMSVDPAAQKLIEALTDLDKERVPEGEAGARHHLKRADLLERIVAAVKATEREQWYRQVADSLSSAAQAEGKMDGSGGRRLMSLEEQIAKAVPGSNLAGYVVFRRLQAGYSSALAGAKGDGFDKVQKAWMEQLTAFVKAYPKAEDTPDAMLQLGMVCEFLGKEVEAKNWYAHLAKAFPGKPQAAKGEGAARRLGLEGETMRLAAPLLSDSGTPFDLDQLRGKVVVVYYWASWNGSASADFAKLKSVLDKGEGKVAVLGVNVDEKADEGRAFARKHDAPGTHVFTPGGLESKLATQYGVMVLPGVFIVGKDGKVINKAAQMGTVEDEVKKALKK
ncbi:MAG: redoxin domain-containing protein [Gemmataceae bacterium]|nr:redoxin domain-containing protein [Gemmataceae bacterium]